MSSLLRTSLRVSRARISVPTYSAVPRRFASTDYGSVQSGHEQGINENNPKKHLEHPGPESPVAKGQASSGSDSSASSKDGAQPKIHQPKSAAEDQSEEVRQHNKEMENRSEKSANQLSEKDNKVDKNFWKGDVGDMSKKNG